MFLDILSFIIIGLLLRILFTFIGVTPEKIDFIRDRINYFVFYYIIPFVCFKTAYTMPFSLSHLKISIVANLTILSCVTISWFIYKKIAQSKNIKTEVIGVLIMCSAFGNVLYIGLPILTNLYGTEGMSYAFTYDFLASTPLTWTVAVAVCMKYGSAKSFNLKNSLKTIIKIPPIWGLIFGFIFRELNITLPEEFIYTTTKISIYMTYLMLLIVGLSIKALQPQRITLLLPAIFIKIVLSPLLALFFGSIIGLSGMPLNVCIIEAATPSMILSMIFATTFGVDLRTAIEMIFLTTIFFCLIVFLLFYFIFS
ncbi:MAG: AEC family transporter [Thermodesulfovibrio sp.]|uniref:AEC family transporter n=1 Tax=unclassified Thermodesulfovibrio TaxID=2645936 RepID=UPI00083A8C06|nr:MULTISPECIES: AEC family transporter [unclassified Thermodesulfovibrio]MDI1472240.1 AEC family transporter [Thermodesulfovibrio sp. 1176]MDI6714102.1 AEC family transporter [Thermodesulfovibrio sp.]ODA44619.1 Malate permease [Thermodesulfovibrio sp. N1]